MNLGKDRCNILTSKQKYFSVVFKYRKNLFPVVLGCQNKPLYYTGSIILQSDHPVSILFTLSFYLELGEVTPKSVLDALANVFLQN